MASIHISKPGKSRSSEGVDIDITPEILSEVAQTYNPAAFEAQLVIGHPSMDAPSFGGIRSLSFGSTGLEAVAEPTDDAKELVSKRHFKSVSASFYTPTAPNNPTPGKWHLRHVGLLGAVPPAVKGLRALSFAEREEGVVTFGELPGYAGSYMASMLRKLREWFIDKEGLETADRILPDWEVESLREISQRAAEQPASAVSQISGGLLASFAEPQNPISTAPKEKPPMSKTPEQLQAELDAANTQIQTLQAADRQRDADTRHAAHVSFAESLVAEARWPGGAKDVLVATLDHLAQPEGVVSFGEGDAAKPLAEVLQAQLKALPPSVSFGEFARKGSGGGETAGPEVVAARAVAYQTEQAAKGERVNTAEAVAHVSRGNA